MADPFQLPFGHNLSETPSQPEDPEPPRKQRKTNNASSDSRRTRAYGILTTLAQELLKDNTLRIESVHLNHTNNGRQPFRFISKEAAAVLPWEETAADWKIGDVDNLEIWCQRGLVGIRMENSGDTLWPDVVSSTGAVGDTMLEALQTVSKTVGGLERLLEECFKTILTEIQVLKTNNAILEKQVKLLSAERDVQNRELEKVSEDLEEMEQAQQELIGKLSAAEKEKAKLREVLQLVGMAEEWAPAEDEN